MHFTWYNLVCVLDPPKPQVTFYWLCSWKGLNLFLVQGQLLWYEFILPVKPFTSNTQSTSALHWNMFVHLFSGWFNLCIFSLSLLKHFIISNIHIITNNDALFLDSKHLSSIKLLALFLYVLTIVLYVICIEYMQAKTFIQYIGLLCVLNISISQ